LLPTSACREWAEDGKHLVNASAVDSQLICGKLHRSQHNSFRPEIINVAEKRCKHLPV
jgi:hypothetical protein